MVWLKLTKTCFYPLVDYFRMGVSKSDRRKQPVNCNQCGLVTMGKNLKRHLREQHHQQVAITFPCPVCDFFSYRSHDLLRHQENCHGCKIVVETVLRPMESKQEAAPPRAGEETSPVVAASPAGTSRHTSLTIQGCRGRHPYQEQSSGGGAETSHPIPG